MFRQNLHTHSLFSDGKASPEAVVREALRQKLNCLGFSDHAPVPFENDFSIKQHELTAYCTEIRRLQQTYQAEIAILLALEIDYIPGLMEGFSHFKKEADLDYVIGSVHLVGKEKPENLWFIDGPLVETYDAGLEQFFGKDIQLAVKAFFSQTNQMIENEVFDVIGHFDKIKMHNKNRYFTEDENWYRKLVFETLDLIKKNNLIVEVNTRGLYKKRAQDFFPSSWILKQLAVMDIPVIVSSDAHQPEEIQLLFPEAFQALKATGHKKTMRFVDGKWHGFDIA